MKILERRIYHYWGVIVVLLLTPVILLSVLHILPTHDDWASLTSPDLNPFFIKERFLFYGYHWRPFDSMIGYIVGRNPQGLFPGFNHVLVVIGHLLCSLVIFRVLTVLGFSRFSKNIITVCFFVLPATMATVTAVDSQNQVYSLLCDTIAFLCYIKQKHNRYLIWISLIFLATLWKENGLMWALICPILAYGFDFIDRRTLKKDLVIGCAIMITYALVIAVMPKDIIIHPEYEPGVMKVVKNLIKFLFLSFVTVDYIYLLHTPSRHLLLAVISLIMTLPFCYFMFIGNSKRIIKKKMICTILCLLIAVGPHLLTIFSMMHTYAGLSLIAIIAAEGIDYYQQKRKIVLISLFFFLTAAFVIDGHLISESIKSGLVGKKMAKEAVRKTGKPVKSVYVIIIEDDYPKLSSFCVIPVDAFGWGIAAKYETNYQWPEIIQDTTITRTPNALYEAREMGNRAVNKGLSDCVWIVNHENIDVVKK